MKKNIKMILTIVIGIVALNSCVPLALGAGAAAGGYTCTKTDVCNKIIDGTSNMINKNKNNNNNNNNNSSYEYDSDVDDYYYEGEEVEE